MDNQIKYEIREAKIKDAHRIAEIHNDCVKEIFMPFMQSKPLPVKSLDERHIYWSEAIEFAEPQVFVATVDGEVVGFAGCDRSRDEGSPQTMGEIFTLNVLPNHRKNGIGSDLLTKANEWLNDEGCTHTSLWVANLNDDAIRFFNQHDFDLDSSAALKEVSLGNFAIEEVRLVATLS